jgi:hypothetical protein
MMRRAGIAGLLLAACLLASGCGPDEPFTRQRYETLYIGMQETQVRQRLGEPTQSTNGRWVYIHEEPYYAAVVEFADGRLVDQAWTWDRDTDLSSLAGAR